MTQKPLLKALYNLSNFSAEPKAEPKEAKSDYAWHVEVLSKLKNDKCKLNYKYEYKLEKSSTPFNVSVVYPGGNKEKKYKISCPHCTFFLFKTKYNVDNPAVVPKHNDHNGVDVCRGSGLPVGYIRVQCPGCGNPKVIAKVNKNRTIATLNYHLNCLSPTKSIKL